MTELTDREWQAWAIAQVEADANRTSDTHLHVFPLPPEWGVRLYLKDESVHPTGSLKHRLARSLVLYGLCNNWIRRDTTLVEASSGSTAVSEAYFARLLGLPFVAVMPASVVDEKCALIGFYGGRCHLVEDPAAIYDEAERIARESGGHYLDQFTYAERATDWRGNNNIAESMVDQLRLEPHPEPTWVVVGAGTGGTSATIGRYLRYQRFATRLCVVDPEGSAFSPGLEHRRPYGHRPRFADRGHRPAPDGAELHPRGRGPDDRGARRRLGGGHAVGHRTAPPTGRRVDRHQPVGCDPADRGDDRHRASGGAWSP